MNILSTIYSHLFEVPTRAMYPKRQPVRAFIGTALFFIVMVAAVSIAATCVVREAKAAEPAPVYGDGGSVSELCPFSPGWNLVVLNGDPQTLPSCVATVWRYEGSEDRWYFWGRDNEPYWNDLTSFAIEKGYWVYVDR